MNKENDNINIINSKISDDKTTDINDAKQPCSND